MITLTLTVDAAAAVRLNKSLCGKQILRLDDAALTELSPDQRDTLARHLNQEKLWGDPLTDNADPIGEANFHTLCRLLDERRAFVRAQGGGR